MKRTTKRGKRKPGRKNRHRPAFVYCGGYAALSRAAGVAQNAIPDNYAFPVSQRI